VRGGGGTMDPGIGRMNLYSGMLHPTIFHDSPGDPLEQASGSKKRKVGTPERSDRNVALGGPEHIKKFVVRGKKIWGTRVQKGFVKGWLDGRWQLETTAKKKKKKNNKRTRPWGRQVYNAEKVVRADNGILRIKVVSKEP